ncbi:pyridoxamine 5'-phosphate oxidase family protein [Polyangium aurulentum]|uniref:pyridoxamine 5'-phosphate oxidase family protein n=1 Tax=Polyangium aurulentum TaxID=2567896 RepID=UPI00200F8D6A|nr:pyridoxamine 5'-phosphate oxidase family protein [Polyangium aurulentum]UQA58501.1 pyridoxamine 5'-phosphate oxidase family protein [Polyangium aurulentum]
MLDPLAPSPAPAWLATVESSLERSRATPEVRYAQLATVDASGAPRCRTIVVRAVVPEHGAIVFSTDARSPKTGEILAEPRAELCWYFAETREQLRIAGEVVLARADAPGPSWLSREALWSALSAASRASFAWPAPGSPRAEGALFPLEPAEEPLATFAACALIAREVDHLRLRSAPHQRTRFTRLPSGAWTSEEVCP